MEENNKIEFRGKYISVSGKRKTAVAQVRLYKNGKGLIIINNKKLLEYFPTSEYKNAAIKPLQLAGLEKSIDFSIVVKGGGKHGQAEAVRHGIAVALVAMDKNLKPILKAEKLLTRDSRKKERKKPGLKKARRAEQWAKR
ncbi:MAG: 30S ribosomal protein S9 [Patescibacteria group bacterium]|jgi:small subunit ribosomal protein S9